MTDESFGITDFSKDMHGGMELRYTQDERTARRLRTLWVFSFVIISLCSTIYELVFYVNTSGSPFPSMCSSLVSLFPLSYLYLLTIAMRKSAKCAKISKLYRFSRIMETFFLFALVFVILYIVIIFFTFWFNTKPLCFPHFWKLDA